MAASVRIEDEAFSDRRFDVLARLLKLPNGDCARGMMASVWRQCTAQGKHVLSVDIVEAILGDGGSTAIVRADLGERVDGGVRIKGTAGRTEWLEKLRANGRKGGRPPHRTNSEPIANQELTSSQAPPNPPAPAPAPAKDLDHILRVDPTAEGTERSQTPASAPPPFCEIPLLAGKYFGVTDELITELSAANPAIDVRREALAARQWCLAHPEKGKRKGRAFLQRWMAKAQERAGNGNGRSPMMTGKQAGVASIFAHAQMLEDQENAAARTEGLRPSIRGNGVVIPGESGDNGARRRLLEAPEWVEHRIDQGGNGKGVLSEPEILANGRGDRSSG